MSGLSKKGAQKHHFRARAAERLNIRIDKQGIHDVINQIQSGKAQFWKKESCRLTHFIVKIGKEQAICVYDNRRHAPVTVMPLEWAKF